jgi:hypothetical protein
MNEMSCMNNKNSKTTLPHKRAFCIILLLLIFSSSVFSQSQNDITLTEQGGSELSVNGGLGLATKGKNSFTSEHSGTSIFFGTAAYHYQLASSVAVGLSYKFLGSHSGHDLLRCHFVGPDLKLRYLMDEHRQALYFTLTPGYLHYADRVKDDKQHPVAFNHSYFAANFAFGYEFAVSRHLSLQINADMLTGRWGANPDYRVFSDNTQYYIDDAGKLREYKEPNYMFEPSLVFFGLNVGISYRF